MKQAGPVYGTGINGAWVTLMGQGRSRLWDRGGHVYGMG